MYVELHSRSAFSFLEGSSLPESLIARCGELQMPVMALLDRDGVYGAPRFHMAAKKAKIKAHIGAEATTEIFGLTNPKIDELTDLRIDKLKSQFSQWHDGEPTGRQSSNSSISKFGNSKINSFRLPL